MTGIARVLAWVEANLGIDAEKGGLADAVLRHVKARCAELRVSPTTYLALVEREDAERAGLVRTVSVGHTWFMRDREQLELLMSRFVGRNTSSPVRIWAAGCATGEEAYSLVLLAVARGIPVRVLATDLNERSLAIAARARYGAWTVRGLTAAEREKLATPSGLFEIPEHLRELVTFERHNLVDPSPKVPGGFDAIVCRNVLLYFTKPRALAAISRMRTVLAPGGALVTAASDVLADGTSPFASELQLAPPAEHPGAPSTPVHASTSDASVPELAASDVALPSADGTEALEHARAALDRGEVDEARELLRGILDVAPLSVDAYLLHGIACDVAGNVFAAMASFRSALVLEPMLWAAEIYLGLGHERLGALQDAQRCFTRGLDLVALRPDASAVSAPTRAMLEESRAQLVDVATSKLAGLGGRARP